MNIPMNSISLEAAGRIAAGALQAGRARSLAPLAVAVLDIRGCLKAVLVEDGASLLRSDIAIGKAAGALNLGAGGRSLARRAASNPNFFHSLDAVSGGRMVAVRGSVLIRGADGGLLGAVGISGDTPEHDELCAVAGIETCGLAADAGE